MKVAIAGTTGLIGREVLQLLNFHPKVDKIISIQRRSTGIKYLKVEEVVTHFDELSEEIIPKNTDAFICCLGTTMKKAKTKQRFKKVDYEYVIKLAQVAKKKGCEHFLVVSAIGVKKNSLFFYNRVKAEMEEELKKMGFKQLDIFQPALLVGRRKDFRLVEKISIWIFKGLNILLIGSFANYSSIHANTVAKSIVKQLFEKREGVFCHRGREMKWKN